MAAVEEAAVMVEAGVVMAAEAVAGATGPAATEALVVHAQAAGQDQAAGPAVPAALGAIASATCHAARYARSAWTRWSISITRMWPDCAATCPSAPRSSLDV